MPRCVELSLFSPPGRRSRPALLAGLLLCLALPLFADEPAKTREQLEREIEERREALEQLEQEPPPVVEEKPEMSRRRSSAGEDVTVGSSRTVRAGESSPGMVLIGGFLEVASTGLVEGDVTVVGGGAKVAGEVSGTLVVVGGSVELADGAEIEGDVISIGGPIRERGNTRVDGQKVQVAFGDFGGFGGIFGGDWGLGHGSWPDSGWGFSVLDLIGRFFRLGLLMVVIFAVLLLAPGRAASIAALVRAQPWRSGLIGLIAEVVFLPLFLLVLAILLISIIGIPLALVVPPLLVLALIAFFLMGYAGVALATGGIFERRFERRFSTYALVLLGLLLIEGWSLAGEILLYLPGPIKVMALLALAFGFFVQYVAWTIGLGAAISDHVARRRSSLPEPVAESRLVDHLDAE